MDEVAGLVAEADVPIGVVAPIATGLDQALDVGHPLGVEVALQLVGQAELPVHVAARGAVEVGPGRVGDEERHLSAVELVAQVEHELGVARQTQRSWTAMPATSPAARAVSIAW